MLPVNGIHMDGAGGQDTWLDAGPPAVHSVQTLKSSAGPTARSRCTQTRGALLAGLLYEVYSMHVDSVAEPGQVLQPGRPDRGSTR